MARRPIPFYTSDNKSFYTSDDLQFNALEEFDGVTITFYNNSAEENVVDKTNFIVQASEVVGVLKEKTNIINPVITFNFDAIPDFNYAYIDSFDRYYFVTDITSIGKNMWEISFKEDVLMTYKDGIFDLNGFIDRNEFDYDEAIEDTKRVAEIGYAVEEVQCNNTLFEHDPLSSDDDYSQPSVVFNGFGLSIDSGLPFPVGG